ncbi:flavohemoglobin [Metarhizium album ARSEF 1941]|uniref:nitric oxide dioxygenase n=1 Tax=Metarhizium album (strain ARSEF 1941) TaxID=1081103 RepID=A0A0B2WQL9_METAS|nr:flavohemoglobin [Metarhizium album ARSEF 1941]KHN95255.1 flavohemoglobin [Metarhizium album ARSEF 1941]
MAAAPTPEQIAIVKSTAPIIKEHGRAITDAFYKNLLSAHPGLKNYFSLRNQQTGAQQLVLANAVFAYAAYIDDLGKLSDAVERIAQKHASLFVKPEHYPIVGQFLVEAFVQVLGSAVTDEVKDAWIAAYQQLANVFIQREAQLYGEHGPDWQSWRKFAIVDKEQDSEDVFHLHLQPTDGTPLPPFRAGQYVSLQIPVPEAEGLLQSRQFSISSAPIDSRRLLRVTVKRGSTVLNASSQDVSEGKVPGLISNTLFERYNVGDEVELSPPRGVFSFDAEAADPDVPVVLLSLGVGATPVVAILDSIVKSSYPSRPVSYIHGARHSGAVCFGKHIRSISKDHGGVTSVLFIKNTKEGDEYTFPGRMNLDSLDRNAHLRLDSAKAEYFACGPPEWMVQTRAWLADHGVDLTRIHLELFGTGGI